MGSAVVFPSIMGLAMFSITMTKAYEMKPMNICLFPLTNYFATNVFFNDLSQI